MQFPQRWFIPLKCNELCYVWRSVGSAAVKAKIGFLRRYMSIARRLKRKIARVERKYFPHSSIVRFEKFQDHSKVELSFYLKTQFEWIQIYGKGLNCLCSSLREYFHFTRGYEQKRYLRLMSSSAKFSLYQRMFVSKILIEIPEGNIEWMCRWLLKF